MRRFEAQAAAYGFRPQREAIRVSLGEKADDFNSCLEAIVLPADTWQMSTNLLWTAADLLVDSDTLVSEQIGFYVGADFLNTPRLTVADHQMDLSAPSRPRDDDDPGLSNALWKVRTSVGRLANGWIGDAVRREKAEQAAAGRKPRTRSRVSAKLSWRQRRPNWPLRSGPSSSGII